MILNDMKENNKIHYINLYQRGVLNSIRVTYNKDMITERYEVFELKTFLLYTYPKSILDFNELYFTG